MSFKFVSDAFKRTTREIHSHRRVIVLYKYNSYICKRLTLLQYRIENIVFHTTFRLITLHANVELNNKFTPSLSNGCYGTLLRVAHSQSTARRRAIDWRPRWRRIQQTSQVSFKIVFSHGLISLQNNGLLKYYRVHVVFENEHFSTVQNDGR